MILRLNRKFIIFYFKLIIVLIVLTFVLFYLKFKTFINNQIIDENSEIEFKQVLNETKTLNNNQNSIKELRKTIEFINRKQEILNYETFGPLLDNHLVIIIQVHNRLQYLSALIHSLENTKGINETLVVFSHDLFDPQINRLITSIKFCKIKQIFFPKSLQLNPKTFPGNSPNDCPRDIHKEEALRIGCNNAMNSDSYGHYREGTYCQTKHHWWWKINIVLDILDITSQHYGYFMFVEEDHYLSPDAIHVWKLINDFRIRNCQNCDIITLGSYLSSTDFVRNGDKIERSKWISSRHNMGFVINRNVWNRIKSCAQVFCTYDDYNWDWSLQYVSDHCLDTPLTTLFVSTARVYHTGGCGLHHKTSKCNNEEIIRKIETNFKNTQKFLFPKKLIFKKSIEKKFRSPKPNGGWGDLRDHNLCLNITRNGYSFL